MLEEELEETRALLLPFVDYDRATREEAQLLKLTCQDLGDDDCVAKARRVLAGDKTTSPSPTAPGGRKRTLERARELMLNKDLDGARAVLFPLVAESATPDLEAVKLLRLVCQDLMDQPCLSLTKGRLAN